MKTYELKSFAKINLALHVTGKLTNLHKIESVIKFIDLHDTISINEINKNKHKVSFIGNFSKNIKKKNTVNKLFEILEKKKILNNKKFQVRIKKNIPQEAGSWRGIYECSYNFKFFNQKKFYQN
jgi:4-diphosphocytidyl-2-C-methyl-D-erythritol kinase